MIVNFLLASIMTENIKQKHCIKFCQKLGNYQTETIQNGLIASKMVKCQRKVRRALAGHPQAKTRK